MHKAAWERPVASLRAQQEWEPGCCLRARASENAVSLQMRGFSKAQDTENGHICRSSHAVYKVTSATRGCLSRACWQRQRGNCGLRNNTKENKVLVRAEAEEKEHLRHLHSVHLLKCKDPYWAFQTWCTVRRERILSNLKWHHWRHEWSSALITRAYLPLIHYPSKKSTIHHMPDD